MKPTPAYDELSGTWTRLHHLSHLQSIVGWDQAANMPPKGNEARAAAMSEMAALLHRMRTDPKLPDQLSRAEQEPLSEEQRANLREMRRQWRSTNALPESLVTRQQLANSRCEHAWRTQRPMTGRASSPTFARCWPAGARRRSCSRNSPACGPTTR
jgi:carboxypeptidase Taq